jgi:hypothetical protein
MTKGNRYTTITVSSAMEILWWALLVLLTTAPAWSLSDLRYLKENILQDIGPKDQRA